MSGTKRFKATGPLRILRPPPVQRARIVARAPVSKHARARKKPQP